MLQVVGAGVGRTGTHSLKFALEKLLGGTCHHMVEVFGHPEEVPVWTDAIDGRPVDWARAHGGLHGAGRLAGSELLAGARGGQPRRVGDPLGARPGLVVHELFEHHLRRIDQAVEQGDEWMTAMTRLFGTRFDDAHRRPCRHDRRLRAAQREGPRRRSRRSACSNGRRRTGGSRSASGSAWPCPTSRFPRPTRRPSSGPWSGCRTSTSSAGPPVPTA